MNKQITISSILNSNLNNETKLYLINLVNNQKEERESFAKEKELLHAKKDILSLSFDDLKPLNI